MANVNFQSNVIPPMSNLDATARVLVTTESNKATYRYASVGNTLYSAAAAVLVEIQGSATMTVRIKRISIWSIVATTASSADLTLLRCTAISASGSNTAITAGKHDKSDGAATAVVNTYAAAALAGTGHAIIGAAPLSLGVLGATQCVWDFCRANDKPLILRGTGDVIQVYNNTLTLGTATYGFEIETEEDNS
jgi:hypothetical protein